MIRPGLSTELVVVIVRTCFDPVRSGFCAVELTVVIPLYTVSGVAASATGGVPMVTVASGVGSNAVLAATAKVMTSVRDSCGSELWQGAGEAPPCAQLLFRRQ